MASGKALGALVVTKAWSMPRAIRSRISATGSGPVASTQWVAPILSRAGNFAGCTSTATMGYAPASAAAMRVLPLRGGR